MRNESIYILHTTITITHKQIIDRLGQLIVKYDYNHPLDLFAPILKQHLTSKAAGFGCRIHNIIENQNMKTCVNSNILSPPHSNLQVLHEMVQ